AVQPGTHRGAALETVVRLPRAEHRLLHGVFGLERRGEHAVAVARQIGAVLVEEATEIAFGFEARLLHVSRVRVELAGRVRGRIFRADADRALRLRERGARACEDDPRD